MTRNTVLQKLGVINDDLVRACSAITPLSLVDLYTRFNEHFDSRWDDVEVFDELYSHSQVLKAMAPEQYEVEFHEYLIRELGNSITSCFSRYYDIETIREYIKKGDY